MALGTANSAHRPWRNPLTCFFGHALQLSWKARRSAALTTVTLVSAQAAPKSYAEVHAAIEQFLAVQARRQNAQSKAN